MGQIDDLLARALREGRCRLGQVLIQPGTDGGFQLRHRGDAGIASETLEAFANVTDAHLIGVNDDAGVYRPLKTAPTLRRGWLLRVSDAADLRRALDILYPGQLALWLAREEGRLPATSLRETVSRQTGMYRITGKLTTDEADRLTAANCRSDGGCLRTILWTIEPGSTPCSRLPSEKFDAGHDQTGAGEAVIPLLCLELCSLVVAAGRAHLKGEKPLPE